MTSVDFRDGWTYVGGALNLAFVLWWAASLGVDAARRAGDLEAVAALAAVVAAPDAALRPLRRGAAVDVLPPEGPLTCPSCATGSITRTTTPTGTGSRRADALDSVDVPALHVGGW